MGIKYGKAFYILTFLEIYVIDYGVSIHSTSLFTHNENSYLVDVCSNNRHGKNCMRVLVDMKNINSIVYHVLLAALEKFNKGKHIYVVPKKISERIFRLTGTNEYVRIKIEKYDQEYDRELLRDGVCIIYFIFLH